MHEKLQAVSVLEHKIQGRVASEDFGKLRELITYVVFEKKKYSALAIGRANFAKSEKTFYA